MSAANYITGASSGALTGFKIGAATAMPHAAGIGAAVGGIMGLFGAGAASGGGGSSKQGEKQKKALRASKKYQLEGLKRDTAYAVQANKEAVAIYNASVDAKNDEAMALYESYLETRETEFKKAMRLYKDSVKAFDEGVNFNDISATMAMRDAERVRNQRVEEISNQVQLMMLELSEGKTLNDFNKSVIKDRMKRSVDSARIARKGLMENVKSDARDISQAITDTGRKFKSFTDTSIAELAIDRKEMEAETFKAQSEALQLQGEFQTLRDTAKLEKKNLKKERQLKDKQLQTQQKKAENQTFYNLQKLALARDEKRAEASIKTDQERRRGLVEQGAQIAKGQAGRSAAKTVQGMAFASEQAQALMASAMTRADAKYNMDRTNLVKELQLTRQNIQDQLDYSKYTEEAGVKRLGIGLDKASIDMKAAKFGLKAQAKNISKFRNQQRIKNIQMQDKKQDAISSIKTNRGKFRDSQKTTSLNLAELANKLLGSQQDFQAQALKGDLDQLSLAVRQQMSLSSAQSSMGSIDDSFKITRDQIAFDKMIANKALEGRLLDKPKMPKALAPPTLIEKANLQPLPEVDWDGLEDAWSKNIKAKMSFNPHSSGEFAKIQQSILGTLDAAAGVAETLIAQPKLPKATDMVSPKNQFTNLTIGGVNSGYDFNSENINMNLANNGFIVDDFSPLDMTLVSQPR